LARALAKLEDALGVGRDEALDVSLGAVSPEVLAAVRRASTEGRKLVIDYYSYGRDGRSRRTVQPWNVVNRAGQWYLSGFCEQAEGERLFRVDRIRAAEVLDEPSPAAPPPEQGPGAAPALYRPAASDPMVVLDLEPAAHWVAEHYPIEGTERLDDGRLRVRLRYHERRWLERLLLQLGAAATLVEGDPAVRAEAAARILRRYGP
jgi:proteasome accessory factor C